MHIGTHTKKFQTQNTENNSINALYSMQEFISEWQIYFCYFDFIHFNTLHSTEFNRHKTHFMHLSLSHFIRFSWYWTCKTTQKLNVPYKAKYKKRSQIANIIRFTLCYLFITLISWLYNIKNILPQISQSQFQNNRFTAQIFWCIQLKCTELQFVFFIDDIEHKFLIT